MNDEELLKSHLADLARRAYERNYNVFSDFLNIEEISELEKIKTELSSPYTIYGGYDEAERCVIGFGEEVRAEEFPIVCIELSPLQQKFADKLTHRDFLGALMNLGINRNTLGDIIVDGNKGYLFCLDSISEYITDNLTRIKHTTMSCRELDSAPDSVLKEPEPKLINVSSLRADAVVSAVYHLSRNSAKTLFAQDKVFVNHKVVQSTSQQFRNGDTVSVRGYGKFIMDEVIRSTKKDRLVVKVLIYV